MERKGSSKYNFLVVFLVALGSFTYGFNSSIMGTVFGLPSFYTYFHLLEVDPNSYTNNIVGGGYSGVIASASLPSRVDTNIPLRTATQGLYSAGGIIGCAIAAWFTDKVGRKRAVQVICVICVVSAILQVAAVHIAMLLVGRFFNGIG